MCPISLPTCGFSCLLADLYTQGMNWCGRFWVESDKGSRRHAGFHRGRLAGLWWSSSTQGTLVFFRVRPTNQRVTHLSGRGTLSRTWLHNHSCPRFEFLSAEDVEDVTRFFVEPPEKKTLILLKRCEFQYANWKYWLQDIYFSQKTKAYSRTL